MTTPAGRGDLRLITPPRDMEGDVRVGLVLGAHPFLPCTEIALVHPYVELSTSMDAVVPGVLAGTSYDVVVQTDLRGVVWTACQLSERVGRLCDATLEHISDLVASARPTSPTGIRIGPALGGRCDRRWPFKAAEGRALDVLTSQCTREVLDGRLPRR